MRNSNLTTEFDYNKFCEDFVVLLTKSEDRIDRINNMVLTLAETTNRIIYFHETTYTIVCNNSINYKQHTPNSCNKTNYCCVL